jgi:hypothetical protein
LNRSDRKMRLRLPPAKITAIVANAQCNTCT